MQNISECQISDCKRATVQFITWYAIPA